MFTILVTHVKSWQSVYFKYMYFMPFLAQKHFEKANSVPKSVLVAFWNGEGNM